MKSYFVRITFDGSLIYGEDVMANSKSEAYIKAKEKLARKLFKKSKLKNYSCNEL